MSIFETSAILETFCEVIVSKGFSGLLRDAEVFFLTQKLTAIKYF